ncbi:MAG TPA: metallopeptidase TldD-related protein, partial [Kofleriaceae bacterium]|nr:metallopeptidase TldD-related protein [Kofleriaceae bacterium]
RYRVGQSIYGAVEPSGDRLTVRSDGTLPWAWESAPLGALGEPVRGFDLVVDGVAAGVALDLREAGRLGVPANGGVRNLVIGPGGAALAALRAPRAGRPRLEVAELAWLETNPRTGAFVAEIGLAALSTGGGESPVAGGAFRGNVFELLARAHLSTETDAGALYRGPSAIRVDDIEIA